MSDKKSFRESISEIIGAERVDKLLTFFKAEKVKFDAVPPVTPPAAPAAPANTEITTQDGKTFSVAGTLIVGAPVMDATTSAPVPDGEYILSDGTSITIAGGAITEIETPAAAATEPPMDMAAATTALKAQFAAEKVEFEKAFNVKFAAQQKDLDEAKSSLKDHNEMLKELVGFMSQVLETTVKTEGKVKLSQEDYNKMSSLEKYRYDKANG